MLFHGCITHPLLFMRKESTMPLFHNSGRRSCFVNIAAQQTKGTQLQVTCTPCPTRGAEPVSKGTQCMGIPLSPYRACAGC